MQNRLNNATPLGLELEKAIQSLSSSADEAFKYIKHYHESGAYANLANTSRESMCPEEVICQALTTYDISTVNPFLLASAIESYKSHLDKFMLKNLVIMVYAIQYHKIKSMSEQECHDYIEQMNSKMNDSTEYESFKNFFSNFSYINIMADKDYRKILTGFDLGNNRSISREEHLNRLGSFVVLVLSDRGSAKSMANFQHHKQMYGMSGPSNIWELIMEREQQGNKLLNLSNIDFSDIKKHLGNGTYFDCPGINLFNANLQGVLLGDASNANLENANLNNANLLNANFDNSILINTTFNNAETKKEYIFDKTKSAIVVKAHFDGGVYLRNEAFNNAQRLRNALTDLQSQYENIPERKELIYAAIAKNIVNKIRQLGLNKGTAKQLIKEARNHSIFHQTHKEKFNRLVHDSKSAITHFKEKHFHHDMTFFNSETNIHVSESADKILKEYEHELSHLSNNHSSKCRM